jgi:hypothetical protein
VRATYSFQPVKPYAASAKTGPEFVGR